MNRTKEGFDPTQKRWGHYPLCPEFDIRPSWCICDRLEQVMDATRADMRAKVEALPQPSFAATSGAVWRAEVLALIDGDK